MTLNSARNQRGVVAMISLMTISIFALVIVFTVSLLAVSDVMMTASLGASERALLGAQSGIEEAIYRISLDPGTSAFSFVLDDVSVDVAVVPDGFLRYVYATSTDATGKKRVVSIQLQTGSFGGGFESAVQAGSGGLVMEEGSEVFGNIFSNGDIIGANNTEIGGNVSISGNHTLTDVIVGTSTPKDLHAHSIIESSNHRTKVSGDAYYTTIESSIEVSGVNCAGGNIHCHPGSADLAFVPPPIDVDVINTWKDEITDTGTDIIGTEFDCSGTPTPGVKYYCIDTDETLGNIYIDADFVEVAGDVEVTISGNVWVRGNITFANAGNGSVRGDASLGDSSAVILADGAVYLSNNYNVSGSGSPKSFILILSTREDGLNPPAIRSNNGSASLILAAPFGELRIFNGGTVKASVAEIIYLEQNSMVSYDHNLASFFIISSDAGSGLVPIADTWEER